MNVKKKSAEKIGNKGLKTVQNSENMAKKSEIFGFFAKKYLSDQNFSKKFQV